LQAAPVQAASPSRPTQPAYGASLGEPGTRERAGTDRRDLFERIGEVFRR
jgi:hypothetical protein